MASMNVQARMRIVRETPAEVLLRYDGSPGLVLSVVMGVGLLCVLAFIPSPAKWFAGGVTGLIFLIALLGAFWREELDLGLATGRWHRRAGWVGKIEETAGDLAEIPEVVLQLARSASSDDSSAAWNVEIKAPSWPAAIVLEAAAREEDGYARLEKWAKALKRDAVDRTGDAPVRRAFGALDAPFSRREEETTGFAVRVSPQPPRGSRIVVTSERGRRRIVIPPVGWNGGVFLVAGFGAVFGGIGGLAALVGAGVITGVRVNGEIPNGPVWFMAAIGTLFFLIGTILALAVLVGGRTSDVIEDGADRLVVGNAWAGMRWGRKTLLKREIEGVDLSVSPNVTWSAVAAKREGRTGPPAGAAKDVRIRSDARVLRIGRYLPEADQLWLRDTLDAMVRGG